MPILLGVRPGGRDGFAVAAIFTEGRLPGRLILSDTLSGVRAVLDRILGVIGEWGELTAAAIDAPLSWSGSPTGRREGDELLQNLVPDWVPKNWFPSPNAMQGAVAIQGPALAWAMAAEAKQKNLPTHEIYETHPRASLARTLRTEREAILAYRDRDIPTADRTAHVRRILGCLLDAGVLVIETSTPETPVELEATVCAVTAMAVAFPNAGFAVHELGGGEIRPVGRRQIIVLGGLP
jgi:hypothetical protein